ncbi:MAG: nucleobase:cation symporter, family [Gaiellaceae bacterium]|nr:nucleobase:cation symporter, family [Gaiellaceae bacterium]
MQDTPQWGIEPVPDRLRVLGLLDTTLLWTNLGISLLVLVLPAYFDLSLRDALAATLVGALIGNLMLAVAALIGADARVPAMVLQRAPLGRRGSYLPTALNVVQCLGWAIFELIVIATAAGLLCDKLFGFKGVWIWKLVFGAVAGVLALLGPVGFVRRFVRKFAIWAVLASVIYLAWWIADGAHLQRIWSEGGHRGSFWLAVDTVVAVTVSWAPLVADYTRFSRDRRTAFFGVGIGYLLPTLFQFGFGSILVLSRGVDPNRPELILIAIAGGGLAAALALLALTVDETDEAFANVYSTAVSAQNLFPRTSQRGLIAAASVLATGGALAIDMRGYQRFLLLLGAVFVPLLGVLVADWLLAGAHYTREHVFGGPAFRPANIVAWVVGFIVYEWLYQPADLGFWSRWIGHLPTPSYQIGASVPSFAVAFLLTAAAVTLGSTRAAARARREPLPGRR